MTFKYLTFLSLLSVAWLSACSQVPTKQQNADLEKISQVTLLQAITIPADSARVFIQNGKTVLRSEFDQYEPHCRFKVQSIKPDLQTLYPEAFEVFEQQNDEENIASSQGVQVAGFSFGIGINYNIASQDNNREPSYDLVHLFLKPTEKNPTIFRLTCAGGIGTGNPSEGEETVRPDKEKMNSILKGIAKIS